jgi:hypothetical protein
LQLSALRSLERPYSRHWHEREAECLHQLALAQIELEKAERASQ